MAEAATHLGADLSGGLDQQLALAAQNMCASEALAAKACEIAVIAGLHLLAARDQFKHGEWLAHLEQIGIDRFRAVEFQRLATTYAGLPPEARKQLVSGGKVRALAITQLDQEALEAAYGSGDLARMAALPKSELLAEVRKLRQRQIKHSHELEKANDRYEKLKGQLDHRHDHLQMPEFAAVTREEAAALTEKMLACVESLCTLVEQNLLGERDEPEGERFQRMAAGTLYHSLVPVAARSLDVLRMIESHHGKDVIASVKFDHQLVKQESAHYLKMRAALLEQHAKQEHSRDAVRVNAKGGRGRPRKVEQ